jgi:CDP-6-deoxy-D-xylo-4-hexulose-3-dehydrase
MERGVLVPVHHGMTNEMFEKVHSTIDLFLSKYLYNINVLN